jgi:hypothetical protein
MVSTTERKYVSWNGDGDTYELNQLIEEGWAPIREVAWRRNDYSGGVLILFIRLKPGTEHETEPEPEVEP